MRPCGQILLVVAAFACTGSASAKERVLDAQMHHLRIGEREWSDFPAQPEGLSLTLRFRADRNVAEQALRLRQQDVKQTWNVRLNGKDLGRLVADENDTAIYLPVP